ncbi:hypothetical protein Plhal304r1_c052g0136251 [Plasmopara halstedii]
MGPDLVHVLTPSQQLTIYWWWVVHALITKLLRNLAVDNLSGNRVVSVCFTTCMVSIVI